MNSRNVLLILVSFFSFQIQAQVVSPSVINLPSLVPPSPEVSALSKMGELSTGLHTGTASVAIPLYELSAGSIKLPIGISYNTNGVRVSDIPSRIGLGWTLSAGGTISKTIHDDEDEDTNVPVHRPVAPTVMTTYSAELFYYLRQATTEGYDTELDEYSFFVNGMSGKFFIDNTGVPRITSHSNLKITKSGSGISIKTSDGILYQFFPTDIEKTTNSKMNGKDRINASMTTGWFLSRITSLEGEWIEFHYNGIATEAMLGANQSVILQHAGANLATICASCIEQFGSVDYNRVSYASRYLSGIVTSTGLSVVLTYEDRPSDQGGDNRLQHLRVLHHDGVSLGSTQLKHYQFEYEDFPLVGSEMNQRFFLKKLKSYSNNPELLEPQVHEFTYNDPGGLPSQKSLSQDFFGFYNGASNTNFFPKPADHSNYQRAVEGANRHPNSLFSIKGSLSKVIFPTGGFEEFVYEANTITSLARFDSGYAASLPVSCIGTGSSTINTCLYTITATAAPIKIAFTTGWNSSGPAPGTTGYSTPDGIHFLSYLEIWNKTTGVRVFEARHREYTGGTHFTTLEPNVEYEVRLKVAGNSHYAYATIFHNYYQQVTPYNAIASGLRVKQLISFDPVSSKTSSKYYTYAALNALDKSSGIGTLETHTGALYHGGQVCTPPGIYSVGGQIAERCTNLYEFSSSSFGSTFTFGGSPVAYEYVIESDDADFLNGGVEHKFQTIYNLSPTSVVLNSPSGVGSTVYPDRNGTELQTIYFKKAGSSFVRLKEVSNQYGHANGPYYSVVSYNVRKRWDGPDELSANISEDDLIACFDIGRTQYWSEWYRLNQSTVTEYDQNGLNPLVKTVRYQYNNSTHLQATEITTASSMGEEITQTFKFPADFTSGVFPAMVSAHVITPVVEQAATKTNTPILTKTETDYVQLTTGSNTFFKPSAVKSFNFPATATEFRMRYHNYDAKGNLTEVSKENDSHVAYLWNYKKALPVAEVKNASLGDVAYTSFEGDDNGGWTFDRTLISTGGITGNNNYSGSLSKSVNSALTYTVTAWGLTYITVNGAPGTLLNTKGSWMLFSWKVSNALNIEVVGEQMDEVRLYPEGAHMTTFTHSPFIGVSSQADLNNRIIYYEYDGFNRLSLIRDIDKNILKKYCYNYQGQTEKCGTTSNGLVGNQVRSGTFTSMNCAAGYTGAPVTYTVGANTFKASSQSQANLLAEADVTQNGQTYANQVAACVPDEVSVFASEMHFGDFTRQCPGNLPSDPVRYTVPHGRYTSTVSTAAANVLAQNDVASNGQAYANENGICISNCNGTTCAGIDKKCVNGVCETGVKVIISSVGSKNNWTCTFVYRFSDCSVTGEYTEQKTSSCPLGTPCAN